IFIDLRDRTGIAQVVFTPAVAGADELRSEYVIKLTGLVKKRPASMVNDKLPNQLGHYEVEAKGLELINASAPLPLAIDGDGHDIGEEVRVKYRYLDLRRPRLQKNIKLRSEFIRRVREFFFAQDFTEIETPVLSAPTPEGSRDFIVPSRLYPGKF